MMCGEKIPEKEYQEFVISTKLLRHLCNLVSVLSPLETIIDITKDGWGVATINANHTMMGFFKIPASDFKVFTPVKRGVEVDFRKISSDIQSFKYKKYPDFITMKLKKDKYLITDGVVNKERAFTNEGPPKPKPKDLDFQVKFNMDVEFIKRVCKAYEGTMAIDFIGKDGVVCLASQDEFGGKSIAKSSVKAPDFETTFTRDYIADMVEHLTGKVSFATSTDYPMLVETSKPFKTTFFIAPRIPEEETKDDK